MPSSTNANSCNYTECYACWEENIKFWCKICQKSFCSENCHRSYEESFYQTEYLSPHQTYNRVIEVYA